MARHAYLIKTEILKNTRLHFNLTKMAFTALHFTVHIDINPLYRCDDGEWRGVEVTEHDVNINVCQLAGRFLSATPVSRSWQEMAFDWRQMWHEPR